MFLSLQQYVVRQNKKKNKNKSYPIPKNQRIMTLAFPYPQAFQKPLLYSDRASKKASERAGEENPNSTRKSCEKAFIHSRFEKNDKKNSPAASQLSILVLPENRFAF